MITKINRNVYREKTRNGARVLFDYKIFRFLDGVNNDIRTYFIVAYNHSGISDYYEIDLETAYKFTTMFYCDENKYLLDEIDELLCR